MAFDKDEVRRAIAERRDYAKVGWAAPKSPLTYGGVNWRPDFVRDSGVMCLLSGDDIPKYIARRIRAAAGDQYDVTCAAALEILTNNENIELLMEADASIIFVVDNGQIRKSKKLLKVLAEQEITLGSDLRRRLVELGLEYCRLAKSSHEKGKRLEDLTHFLFSQVSDFRVLKCNWKTRNEELDCVIQVRSFSSDRCWAVLGAPYLIVEAKNRAEKTEQETVSKLRSVMDGKRNTCRIGFIISISGFTSGARDQVLRFATEDNIFVLLEPEDILEWSSSEDYEEKLDEITSKAILD